MGDRVRGRPLQTVAFSTPKMTRRHRNNRLMHKCSIAEGSIVKMGKVEGFNTEMSSTGSDY